MGPTGPDISREDGRLSIVMPVAPDRWLVGLGLGVAAPWLVATVRFGAGLSATGAQRVRDVLAEEFGRRAWR